MTKAQELVAALAAQVGDEFGWLSDAQHASLEFDETAQSIRFHGEGSIDLLHLAEIAEHVFEKEAGA